MSAGDLTEYASVASYLFGLKPRGGKLGIERMRPFAAELGHPERSLPCIHVSGTNGKGSVAAMIEAILRTAGWKVGLFTSPHLIYLGERVQVNRQPLSECEIVAHTRTLDAVSDRLSLGQTSDDRPSFFEFMTAMAFLEFQRTACDIAVFEVGLGGEFDATNIVLPEVSVITSIGLDHCEWLGDSIAGIARAKAGIIKRNRPVVLGRMPLEAEKVIREIAARSLAGVSSVCEEYGDNLSNYPETSLSGDYQRWNAATATLAIRSLDTKWRIDESIIGRGLQAVAWAGRWERTQIGGRAVVLDASHNAEGAEVLEANLSALVEETGRRPVVIVGVLGGERAAALMATICRHARQVYLVVPAQPRATSHQELEKLVPPTSKHLLTRSTVADLFPGGDVCTAGDALDAVVVTGSIYLLGEVLTRLGARPPG